MKQYHDMALNVLENGTDSDDRTGVGTRRVFGTQSRYDLKDGFPAATTKRLAWKSVVGEILWFLEGSTDERRLAELTFSKPRTELTEKRTIWTDNADNQAVALGYMHNTHVKHLGPLYGHTWRRTTVHNSEEIIEIEPRKVDTIFMEPAEFVMEEPFPTSDDDEFVGRTFVSNGGRQYVVLSKEIKSPNSMYRVQFTDNGKTMWVSRPNLKNGFVGNKLLFGFAIGSDKQSGLTRDQRKIYDLWYNMMTRCYDSTNKFYEYYGGSGVFVCKRWHDFANFIEDVERLPGFYEWLKDGFAYNLDKDYYAADGYAPNTCVFIPRDMNIAISNKGMNYSKKKVVHFPDGSSFEFLLNKDLMHKYPHMNFTHEGIRMSINNGGKHRKCHFSIVDSDKIYRKRVFIDQIRELIERIKSTPDSRRLVVSAWNVADVNTMALPPCHTMFQFYVENGELSCQLYQRSSDTFLGVPFNIASYALLTHMIARECGLEVGEFVHTTGDTHIYQNHFDQVIEQLHRAPRSLPTLKIADDFDLMDRLKNGFRLDDTARFTLEGYDPHPTIKAPMAV